MELLDNWWPEVNITVSSDVECNISTVAGIPADVTTQQIEIVNPNLYPDSWDVDVEYDASMTRLQFDRSFRFNIWIQKSYNLY